MPQGRWWAAAGWLLLWCALAWFVGWLLGRPALVFALAFVLLFLWQFRRVHGLGAWLQSGGRAGVPEFGGAWGELVAQALRLFRRKDHYKHRLVELMRELRQSSAALPDGVVVLNGQAEIAWCNANAGRMLGLRAPGDYGMRIDNLLRQPQFTRYLQSGDYSQPVTLRTSAAVEQYLQMHIVPYGEGQQLLLVRDVTRSALLELMRKDFVANASHELRSPLTVISGYLETLGQDPGLDAGLQAPVAEMRRQAARMNAIVADLLELSRLESSERRANRQSVDVAELLAELERDARSRSRERRLGFFVDCDRRLLGDAGQLRSAFGNLLENALKYTPATGSVEVRWWCDGQGGHLSVTDTGIGIGAEHLPRLTERFYRVDAGRSRETGGSGLGLAIVKHVLQQHDATLEIRSEEGHGSCFTCHFPATRLAGPG